MIKVEEPDVQRDLGSSSAGKHRRDNANEPE